MKLNDLKINLVLKIYFTEKTKFGTIGISYYLPSINKRFILLSLIVKLQALIIVCYCF